MENAKTLEEWIQWAEKQRFEKVVVVDEDTLKAVTDLMPANCRFRSIHFENSLLLRDKCLVVV
jgi:hypothetical protein